MQNLYLVLTSMMCCASLFGCEKKPTKEAVVAEVPKPSPADSEGTELEMFNTNTVDPSADMVSTIEDLNAFTFDLYNRIEKKGNDLISAFSVGTALSLVELGSHGNTQKELHNVLNIESSQSHQKGLVETINHIEGIGKVVQGYSDEVTGHVLTISNAIWVDKSISLLPNFSKSANENFGAQITSMDVQQPDKAANAINAWVKDKTKEKIKTIVNPGDITPQTKVALVNAIYFLGQWQHTFDKARTKPLPFYTNGNKSQKAPLMSQTQAFSAMKNEKVSIVDLPYESTSINVEMTMTLIIPNKRDGLAAIEKSLSHAQVTNWLTQLQPNTQVTLTMPKWESAKRYKFKDHLSRMGLSSLFSDKADFSKMSLDPIAFGSVIHKTFIRVDEEGTEAAAVTAILTRAGGVPPKPIEIRADHPFLYLLRDRKSGAILFIGRMLNPLARE